MKILSQHDPSPAGKSEDVVLENSGGSFGILEFWVEEELGLGVVGSCDQLCR